LSIRLPRDLDRITAFRHELDQALGDFGVGDQGRADVGLVLSEVCTNVVSHVARGDQYDVVARADWLECSIEVRPDGPTKTGAPNILAESGRALQIVTAVASRVEVDDGERPGVLRRVVVTFAGAAP